MWMLYHFALLHMQEQMRTSRLRSTRSRGSTYGSAPAEPLGGSMGGTTNTTTSTSLDNSDSGSLFSKVTIAQLVMSADMELDALLHLVYDRTILNKVRLLLKTNGCCTQVVPFKNAQLTYLS